MSIGAKSDHSATSFQDLIVKTRKKAITYLESVLISRNTRARLNTVVSDDSDLSQDGQLQQALLLRPKLPVLSKAS